ncbi:MAG: hypothetical protein C0592_07280 [Marinilabiliales bacterium]|nr:MAG: hypothetical protein C0592_07280 [Marinilabiliales bacterium]
MHETFTPESLISHLYHSNTEITESFLDSVFSDEFLMNSFVDTADKLYTRADVSVETIQNIHQFASSVSVPGSEKLVFMS